MASKPYATQAPSISTFPPGIPFIIGNEAAERFSFYGMRAILMVFMTKLLRDRMGALAPLSKEEAMVCYHSFEAAAYFFPLAGALLSDIFLGKYRTILSLSIVYCLGHLALALDDTLLGLQVGLTLIAIGSGGIKPCVSSHVGDQFGAGNRHLLERAFYWFYFSINAGSVVATLLIPKLLESYGPHVAFGVPGVLMGVATVVFWLGRNRFVHVPPGGRKFLRDLLDPEGLRALGRLSVVYLFSAAFWCLSDQAYSAWVDQAGRMDLRFLGNTWLPSQISAVNPLLVLVFIPAFAYGLYPALNRFFRLTSLRKIGIGLVFPVIAFLLSAWIEQRLAAGIRVNVGWQLLGHALLTAGEVLCYGTCLEFSYTQAPARMKSAVMSLMLASISLGNGLTALVNKLIQNPDHTAKLSGAPYYLAFAAFMTVAVVVYVPVAMRFRVKELVSGADDSSPA
ncbi:MAG TPA: MFS transporter [Verrucomicrobiales bacterium]|nr:MFS transporter [Verrucomicrobiales bacterium]